jgi:hypothetical protein
MAKVEWITVKGGFETAMKPYFNLDGSVGAGGANLQGDVMVVQALLRFPTWVQSTPMVTGKLDDATKRAIVEFVDFNPFSRMQISDPVGLVLPGFVGGSVLKTAQPKKMIEELNYYLEHSVKSREPDLPADGAVRTAVYSYPSLKSVKGVVIDKYGKASVKYPDSGAIINVKHRR